MAQLDAALAVALESRAPGSGAVAEAARVGGGAEGAAGAADPGAGAVCEDLRGGRAGEEEMRGGGRGGRNDGRDDDDRWG